MAEKNTELDINDKHQLILLHGVNKGRQTILARLDPPGGYTTIYWVNRDLRDTYHKSVTAFLPTQNIHVSTFLIEGQKPDVIPAKAPPRPKQHKMQGDLTPDELDWVYKWAPVEFENRMGVKLRELKAGEDAPKDTRDLWVRDNVVRIHNQPIKATHGGEYLSVKFTAENQIIARRASHLTFTEKEIYRSEIDPATGDTVQVMAEPYKDIYSPEALEQMEKNDKIKVLWKRPGTASAGSVF
jgi:hypothetical protein